MRNGAELLPDTAHRLAPRAECPVCGANAAVLGAKVGVFTGWRFEIRRCPECRFAFVADPWVDYAAIYSEGYYEGRGADPLVAYGDELRDWDGTIRRYEWRGLHARVRSLADVGPDTSWLDYGCGLGGFVRYLRRAGLRGAVGTDQPSLVERLVADGVPALDADQLERAERLFDVVTAVEVVEHVVDPVAELRRIRTLLRPGGLLFVTTGNAAPHAERLIDWSYLVPEIHVSLFEPRSLARALELSGFEPEFPGYGPGWTDIVRFKVLKNLRRRRSGGWERLVPWPVVSRLVDRRLAVAAQPVGRASTMPGSVERRPTPGRAPTMTPSPADDDRID